MYPLFNSHSMFQLTAPLREPTTGEDDVPSVYVCFNSRLPCGSRRELDSTFFYNNRVSTHGSLAGADIALIRDYITDLSFNSRLPCGSRPVNCHTCLQLTTFQLTAPLREPTTRLV